MDSDGTSKALEWLPRGRLFSSEEAAREGLVHHFMPSDVLVAARETAKEFLDKPARALASVKQPIRVSANQPLVETRSRGALVHRTILNYLSLFSC
jgi:enoyl-CoA hydratase/carnithine racemase